MLQSNCKGGCVVSQKNELQELWAEKNAWKLFYIKST